MDLSLFYNQITLNASKHFKNDDHTIPKFAGNGLSNTNIVNGVQK